MPAISERIEFMPPAPDGTGRALAFAVLAHLLLAGALTWGVSWKRETSSESFDAELWSALPQQAAPRAVQPAAPPAPTRPKPVVEKAPEPPLAKAPDIAIDKEKPKPPPKVEPKPDPEPAPKPQAKAEPKVDPRKAQQEQAKRDQEQREKEREANLQRIAGLAGATGAPSATGNAPQTAGPGGVSSSYGGRIKARVRPNIAFTGDSSGNPRVEIEVRLAPDGTILGRPRVIKSSGNREWDESVVRGFEKTEILPRDENGNVPSTLVIGWRPND
jgi:colicin import membrane protein